MANLPDKEPSAGLKSLRLAKYALLRHYQANMVNSGALTIILLSSCLTHKQEMKSIITFLAFLLSISLSAEAQTPANEFWASLQKHCGKAYEGQLKLPKDDTAFGGKKLVMHVRSCSATEIKVPFFVGDDKSRTWVFTLKDGLITLKHDHRHEDGSEDEVTQYGGTASNSGSATLQFFPADQHTATLLPRAASNVWSVSLDETTFGYNLTRIYNNTVFKVVFDLTKPVDEPGAPWGWGK